MPTLNWIGKDTVIRHHQNVPFRLLEPAPALSLPSPASGRGAGGEGGFDGIFIVRGDHLHVLKVLSRYAGQVRHDPAAPSRNLGSGRLASNDNLNKQEIRKSLQSGGRFRCLMVTGTRRERIAA